MNYASDRYKVRVERKKSTDRKEASFMDYLVVFKQNRKYRKSSDGNIQCSAGEVEGRAEG